MWLSAFFQSFATGFEGSSAPALSTLWWLGLLTAALWRLAGGRKGAGALAVLALLLTLPVAKYSLRAGLEIPFTACVCAAVESLRARRRRGAILGGFFFGGALLTRGVFGFLVPLLWIADARVGHRRPMRRILSAGVLGITLAIAFDLFHQAQGDGASFWATYFQNQVLPSLQGVAPHAETGSTWSYYATRLGIYSLPWGLLILWRLPNRLMRMRPEVPLCFWWIAVVYVGASIAHREGSRYLFAAWPAVALLFSALWREDFEALAEKKRVRWGGLVTLLVPCTLVFGTLLSDTQKDSWTQSAHRLAERQSYGWENDTPPVLFSEDFSSHDDRLKQFIRWHLNTWAFWSPDPPKENVRPAWKVQKLDLYKLSAPIEGTTFWCPTFKAQQL
jgi:hypothetical protein